MTAFFRYIKSLLLFCSLVLNSFSLLSQKIIDVQYQQDSKGGYVFSCVNNAYCNYILDLGFTAFDNLKSDQPLPFHAEVKPGYNKLFTISAIDAQAAVKFKYSSGFQKGCMHPVVTGISFTCFQSHPERTPRYMKCHLLKNLRILHTGMFYDSK